MASEKQGKYLNLVSVITGLKLPLKQDIEKKSCSCSSPYVVSALRYKLTDSFLHFSLFTFLPPCSLDYCSVQGHEDDFHNQS